MSALLVLLISVWYLTIPLFLMAFALVHLTIRRKTPALNANEIQRLLKSHQEHASRVEALERELSTSRTEVGRIRTERSQTDVVAARQLEVATKEFGDCRSECARLSHEVDQLRGQIDGHAATREEHIQALAASQRQNEEAGQSIEALRQQLDGERTERTRAEQRILDQSAMAEESRCRAQELARVLEKRTRELQEYRLARITFLEADCAKSLKDEAEARNRREACEAELRCLRGEHSEAECYPGGSQTAVQNGCEPHGSFVQEEFAQERHQLNDRLLRQTIEIESLKRTLEMIGILA